MYLCDPNALNFEIILSWLTINTLWSAQYFSFCYQIQILDKKCLVVERVDGVLVEYSLPLESFVDGWLDGWLVWKIKGTGEWLWEIFYKEGLGWEEIEG